MLRYLLRRLNLFISTSLVLFLVLFIATHQFPAQLETSLSGLNNPTATELEQIRQDYRLDDSMVSQFFGYIQQRLSGNFGLSLTSQQSVFSELKGVLPASLELIIFTSFFALILGITLGMFASLSRTKVSQNVIMALTLTGYSIPVFWLGLSLSLWFGVKLGWLPVSGQINLLYEIKPITGFILVDILTSDVPYRLAAFKDAVMHLILPALTLCVFPFTVVLRITRDAMVNIMSQTYISAAAARGLSANKVILKHALPNSLIPLLKHLGLMLGTFVSYAIIVEVIFSWPGMGSWLVNGIYQRDYTVIQGGVLTVAVLIIFCSIIIDILHTVLNPISRKELYASY